MYCIPIARPDGASYSVVLILGEDNVDRIRAHDPAVFEPSKIGAPWTGMKLEQTDEAWSNALTQRDEARAIADPFVCDFISNASAEQDHGWREIGEYPADMEPYLVYASARELIMRDPANQARFRFTEKGRECL